MRLIDADTLLNELDKEVAKKYNDEWIPCSERLPDESLNSVIGWDEFRKRCCFVQYLCGRFIIGDDTDSVKITAWQPLPEPYNSKVEPEITNADRIRSMSDKELAGFLIGFKNTFGEEYEGEMSCLDWLQSEVE